MNLKKYDRKCIKKDTVKEYIIYLIDNENWLCPGGCEICCDVHPIWWYDFI